MIVTAFVVVFALGDLACVAWLLTSPDGHGLVIQLGAHAGIALASAAALTIGSQPVHAEERKPFFALACAVALFLPGLGPIGLAAALKSAGTRRAAGSLPWTLLEIERDPADMHPASVKRRISAAAIGAALRDKSPARAEVRFQAVLQTKHVAPRVAVTLLRRALKDPSDEVRLFAFSRLERMRAQLETDIGQLTAALEEAWEPARIARTHLRLAQAHWELAYLSLAEGASLDHALEEARLHAVSACTFPRRGNGPAEFVLGRVLLRQGRHEQARAAFENAARAGYSRSRLVPYVAECAFHARQFADVQALVGDIGAASPPAYLRPILEFWR